MDGGQGVRPRGGLPGAINNADTTCVDGACAGIRPGAGDSPAPGAAGQKWAAFSHMWVRMLAA